MGCCNTLLCFRIHITVKYSDMLQRFSVNYMLGSGSMLYNVYILIRYWVGWYTLVRSLPCVADWYNALNSNMLQNVVVYCKCIVMLLSVLIKCIMCQYVAECINTLRGVLINCNYAMHTEIFLSVSVYPATCTDMLQNRLIQCIVYWNVAECIAIYISAATYSVLLCCRIFQ